MTESNSEKVELEQRIGQFSLAFAQLPDSILITDSEFHIVSINNPFEELYGYTLEEIMGKRPDFLNVEPMAEKIQQEIYDTVTRNDIWAGQSLNARKDGTTFLCGMTVSALNNEQGKPFAYIGTQKDITELKKAEEALRESESSLNDAQKIAKMGSWEWDLVNQTNRWSENYFTLHGLNPTEVEPSFELFRTRIHPEDIHLLDEIHTAIMGDKAPSTFELRLIQADGTFKWIQNSITSFVEDDKLVKLKGVVIDITDKKNAELALIRQERFGAIGEIAAGVAHDFNNSLQSIFGNLELALIEHLPVEARECLETVKKSAGDAAERIKQLQRFAGKRTETAVYTMVRINSVVDDAIAQSRHLWKDEAEKQGVGIDIKTNYSGNLTVLGNDSELRSVLYNLLKNGIQAIPQGGSITINTRMENDKVYLTVEDTGVGMDENTSMRVFQPFFTTKGYEQGRGLGLSSVYALVKEHKGDIYVKRTAIGEGTSMEMMFPYVQGKPVSEQKPEPGYKGSANVLWVDDEEPIIKAGKRVLKHLGHTADGAGSGQEAIEILANGQYDLMITDVGMPGMSGWQLAEKVKEMYPGMKIAVVSGWGGEDVTAEQRLKYGVGYILGKPVSSEQLEKLVGEVLQMKQV